MDSYPPPPPPQYPQHGYPPPPPMQQPPFYQPPPRQPAGNNAGKIIGGVVAAVVICASVAVGFLKGQRAARAFGGGGTSRVSRAQASSAASTVMTLNSQLQLYRLQHHDNYPDFKTYPNWEQLSQYTDAAGRVSRTRTQQAFYGPYIHLPPVNPYNDLSTVTTMNNVQAGMTVPLGKVGYVMDSRTGAIWMTDAGGLKVATPDGY